MATEEHLHRMAAIADADLARLDPTTLLDEILDRIRDLLDADTVAVLTLEPGGRHLVAHAARGLEEEVRQGVHVPIGEGFAGRIAAERAPVILDDVGPGVVVNPVLWHKGIRSMLGVPLLAGGILVGVLHVGTLEERRFNEQDATLLQFAADRMAAAIVAEQSHAERTAARTFQRSLLPSRLPEVPGLDFASRFVPAAALGVGGDWYDVFLLPDGHVGIVMGDIAGRGLRASVVMSRMRSVVRAYALETLDPADTLDRVDRKFAHFEPGEMATVLYAVVDPSLASLAIATAGHPPPLAAGADDAEAAFFEVPPGPPIGVRARAGRSTTVVPLEPWTTVGFYTDGLIERRGEPIDVGMERLRTAFRNGIPEQVCRVVMAAVIGMARIDDDTALLVLRRDA